MLLWWRYGILERQRLRTASKEAAKILKAAQACAKRVVTQAVRKAKRQAKRKASTDARAGMPVGRRGSSAVRGGMLAERSAEIFPPCPTVQIRPARQPRVCGHCMLPRDHERADCPLKKREDAGAL